MSGEIKDEPNAREEMEPFASSYHAPVLCNTVVKLLVTNPEGIYVDGTMGGGGHTAALLDKLEVRGRVLGIDRDDAAISEAETRLRSEIEQKRLILARGNFSDIEQIIGQAGFGQVDGLLLDLGVSSFQLDSPERGFSHRLDAQIDMRMDQREATSALQVVNDWEIGEIASIIRRYGEEPGAKSIARSIVENRPIVSTAELAACIRAGVPTNREAKAVQRSFQAVRIAVNRELEALEIALNAAVHVLKEGGRLAVISYHSLEDRRVKRFFRSGNFEGDLMRDIYGKKLVPFKEVTKRPVFPTDEEKSRNPRARSARLRVAERLG